MKNARFKCIFLISFALNFAIFIAGYFILETTREEAACAADNIESPVVKPLPTIHFSPQNQASSKPFLTWTKVEGAVAYELELLAQPPENPAKPASPPDCLFSTTAIYVNGFNANLPEYFTDIFFYWRVRGLDIEGNPVSSFSDAEKAYMDRLQTSVQKPVPTSIFNQSANTALLYPVYSWIPVAGADKYEVEILDASPENPNGTEPSRHRIDDAIATGFDYYDKNPRLAEHLRYWRVRGLDQDGNPVGVYSDAGSLGVSPLMHFTVATFGDSITHGGGSVSYSPADWEYSYQYYLNFPSINLGKSGDTSQSTVERFEQDVLPFQPQYLIILTGTNSLRGGTTAAEIIDNLQELKEKCLSNNIRPVFLTLPPINPGNIQKIFGESTVPDWQEQMRRVNAFIRTQVHIDVAREMESPNGILPAKLAIDGLHLDIEGKKKIAMAINANWSRIVGLPWPDVITGD
ncbi:MAG TPA: GDSL-type esterase/lipase family protein [Patescibacteria group bacterium]|nr:GDSL-type esterase/lipase family protein [Patescibacteria group bacterium]